MRNRIVFVALALLAIGVGFYGFKKVHAQSISNPTYRYSYLSGALFAQGGETIEAQVINAGSFAQNVDVKIWRYSCSGCGVGTLVLDSPYSNFPAGYRIPFQYTVPSGVAVQVLTTSTDILPELDIAPSPCCFVPRLSVRGSEFILLKDQF